MVCFPRELLKALYEEWRKVGRPRPRGFVFCDMSVAKKNPTFLADFVRQAYDGMLDVEAIADGEFNAAAQSFFRHHGIPLPEE